MMERIFLFRRHSITRCRRQSATSSTPSASRRRWTSSLRTPRKTSITPYLWLLSLSLLWNAVHQMLLTEWHCKMNPFHTHTHTHARHICPYKPLLTHLTSHSPPLQRRAHRGVAVAVRCVCAPRRRLEGTRRHRPPTREESGREETYGIGWRCLLLSCY